jgi:hypothetical protein
MNHSKPFVKLYGIDGWLQWDICDLEGLPPEREPGSIHDMGKIPKGQWENLPKMFTAKYISNNKSVSKQFFIQNIYIIKPS